MSFLTEEQVTVTNLDWFVEKVREYTGFDYLTATDVDQALMLLDAMDEIWSIQATADIVQVAFNIPTASYALHEINRHFNTYDQNVLAKYASAEQRDTIYSINRNIEGEVRKVAAIEGIADLMNNLNAQYASKPIALVFEYLKRPEHIVLQGSDLKVVVRNYG